MIALCEEACIYSHICQRPSFVLESIRIISIFFFAVFITDNQEPEL